jgi:carbamoyltransferase
MIILGIHEGHDTSAALVRDGRLVAAVSEGRLRRSKHWDARRHLGGMPCRAVAAVLAQAGLRPADVEVVAAPLAPVRDDWRRGARQAASGLSGLVARAASAGLKVGRQTRIARFLWREGVGSGYFAVHHHVAHAASAWMTSGWDEGVVLTLDGKGDLLSGLVGRFGPGGLEVLDEIDQSDSVATLYSAVTELFGFRADRDEGKVTAMAGTGGPDAEARAVLRSMLRWGGGPHNSAIRSRAGVTTLVKQPTSALTAYLRGALGTRPPADVAFELQRLLEEIVVELVESAVRRAGTGRVAAAGGLFANVTLNRRVEALPCVDSFWVHPAMGDSGLAAGAALHASAVLEGARPYRLPDVFLGPVVTDGEAIEALRARGLPVLPFQGAGRIADLLADGKAVAVCRGPLEYGPRALGNRSILLRPDDRTARVWLNRVLGRDEVMPFAPAVARAAAPRCFEEGVGAVNGPFMTTSFVATPWMREHCVGVVHADGTVRAQLVDDVGAPLLADLIGAFEARTGLPCLLNTSFNRHGEAIVASAGDALDVWLETGLDYLLVAGFLVGPEQRPG